MEKLRRAWLKILQGLERGCPKALELVSRLRTFASPFGRYVFPEVEATVNPDSGAPTLLIGPASASPSVVFEPVEGFGTILEEFDYRYDADNATAGQKGTKLQFLVNDEQPRELPQFSLGSKIPHVFGALKPWLLLPREGVLKLNYVGDATPTEADFTLQVALAIRLEPDWLLEAAGLIGPQGGR